MAEGPARFKGGVQIYFDSSNGYNSFYVLPNAVMGAGNIPFAKINTISGIGTNLTQAQNMLGDLSGSLVTGWRQSFNSAGGKNPTYIPGETDAAGLAPARVQRLFQGRLESEPHVSR